jgi:hypothetical protein
MGGRWFETREDALLTMKDLFPRCALNHESEAIAVAPDTPRGEMSADHQSGRIRKTRE